MTLAVRRKPYYSTVVQQSIGGKELRASWWPAPRYKYNVEFAFARSASAYQEFQSLMSFFARHAGQYESFLFTDPEDSVALDMGFGCGDGTTTQFQLQRMLRSSYVGPYGSFPGYDVPRTNRTRYSQDAANWNLNAGVSVIPNTHIAPDGTLTADTIVYDGTGAAGDYRTYSTQGTPAIALPPAGQWWTASIWMRAEAATTIRLAQNLSGGEAVCALTTEWQRFSASVAAPGNRSPSVYLYSPAAVNTPFVIQVWGAQQEISPVPTDYIPNLSTGITTDKPAYWPALGDGFEPVFDFDPASVVIEQDGDWQGLRQLYPRPRTNYIYSSETLDAANWTKNPGTTVTPNAATAPDGTLTADQISYDGTNTVDTSRIFQYFRGTPQPPVAGRNTVVSIWLKAAAPLTIRLWGNLGASVTCNLTTTWQRFQCAAPANGSSWLVLHMYSALGNNAPISWFAWGGQIELDEPAATPYIKSNAGAVTTVTDYTLSSTGLVTLASALPSNAWLLWSGNYYRRVRFATDELDAQRLLNQIWEAKAVELVSVK